MSQGLVVQHMHPAPVDGADYHLKRAVEEQARVFHASSPAAAACHFELSRLHTAVVGRKGFEPGLLARVEAPASERVCPVPCLP